MAELEIIDILKNYEIKFVDQPVFCDINIVETKEGYQLINKSMVVYMWHVEHFIKALKTPHAIKRIFIFKDQDSILWRDNLIRGIIEIKNKRYSFKNKFKLCQQEN